MSCKVIYIWGSRVFMRTAQGLYIHPSTTHRTYQSRQSMKSSLNLRLLLSNGKTGVRISQFVCSVNWFLKYCCFLIFVMRLFDLGVNRIFLVDWHCEFYMGWFDVYFGSITESAAGVLQWQPVCRIEPIRNFRLKIHE